MRESNTVPAFPDIEDQLGYNPARFLDTSTSKRRNQIGDTSPFATADALIRGIRDLETIRAWIAIEVALERGENGGARKDVIRKLNKRQRQLESATSDQQPVTATADDETHKIPSDAAEETDATTADAPEPLSQPAPASDPPKHSDTALAADGGEEPPSDPLCPVCATSLTAEEIDGRVGYWCSPCGDFQELATAAPEPTA